MQHITEWEHLTREQCFATPACHEAWSHHFRWPHQYPEVILAKDVPELPPLESWLISTFDVTTRQAGDVAEFLLGLPYFIGGLFVLWLLWKIISIPFKRWAENQRAWDEEQNQLHGSAREASRGDLEDAGMMGKNSAGLLIGRAGPGWDNQLVRYPGDAHLITFAPTGSGKGVSAVIPNLLDYQGSVICIDPKGENAAITARRREMGQDVHLLDPWGLAGDETASFNPIDWLDPDGETFEEDALMLADTLVMDSANDHWSKEATALMAGILMHIAASEPEQNQHLLQLNRLLSLPPAEFADLLVAMSQSPVEAVQLCANRFRGKSPNEASGVMSSAQSHLHFLETRAMRRVLSRSDFDPLKIKAKPTTIYLILPAERLSSHARWLRLMVSLFLAALAKDRTRPEKPVLFMLDEFAALGRLQMVETAMGLMRGYGVKLWPILQDLSQLRAHYREQWESFIANAGAIQVFGTNDQSTAQYFSHMAGMTTMQAESSNDAGSSFSRTGRALFMLDEIRRINSVNQLLFVQGMHPCMVGKAFYYAMSQFKGMYDPTTPIETIRTASNGFLWPAMVPSSGMVAK